MGSFHTSLVDHVELVDIPPTQWLACKAVLRAIGDHANQASADMGWPGIELLMLKTGASERVIVRTTTLLAKYGWITKKRRSGTSNVYRINVPKLQKHQVNIPAKQTGDMVQHLPDLVFPGEDLSHIPGYKAANSKRSTARKRAKKAENQASDQPLRQSGVKETPNRREGNANLAGRTRQSGVLTNKEPSKNHLSMDGVDGSLKNQEPKAAKSPSGPGKVEQWIAEASATHGAPAHLIPKALERLVSACPGWNPHKQAIWDIACLIGQVKWSPKEITVRVCEGEFNPKIVTSRLRSNAEAATIKINPGPFEGPKNVSVDEPTHPGYSWEEFAAAQAALLAKTKASL